MALVFSKCQIYIQIIIVSCDWFKLFHSLSYDFDQSKFLLSPQMIMNLLLFEDIMGLF